MSGGSGGSLRIKQRGQCRTSGGSDGSWSINVDNAAGVLAAVAAESECRGGLQEGVRGDGGWSINVERTVQ
jgi:hypothetical protein